jgi:cytochrome c oxidase assembly protein subunit 11
MKRLSRNHTVLASCVAVVATMGGLAYAAVPLYDMFCRVTGYAGTPKRAATAPGAVESRRLITVRFDANVDPALPWSFQPVQRAITVKPGENHLIFYRAENKTSEPIIGHATFNVAPDQAGRFFSKIECFCFKEQRLEPGQSVEMPVSFFIDPAILTDRDGRGFDEITLSYTFFRSAVRKTASATVSAGGG